MLRDILYALRGLRRSPAFSITAIAALAIGIGATTAIFAAIDVVLFKPLPYQHTERLVRIQRGSSYPDMRDWIARAKLFDGFGAYRPQYFDLLTAGAPVRLDGALVTGNFFDILGARAQTGRLLGPDDDRSGAARQIVLGDGVWRRLFGGDRGIVGRAVTFGRTTYEVVGVLEPGFQPPGARADVYAAVSVDSPREPIFRGAHTMRAYGLVKDGVSLEQAQAEMLAIAVALEREYPADNREMRFNLQPLRASLTSDSRPMMLVLLGAVACVLLIACANFASLLLVRAAERRAELAVRAAFGASRWKLARAMLSESLAIAGLGMAASLAVAWTIARAIAASAPDTLADVQTAGIGGRPLLFALAAAALIGIACGLIPALSASRNGLLAASAPAGRGGGIGRGLRSAFVIAEVALSLMLLIGAGLLINSVWQLQKVDLGFRTERVLTFHLLLPAGRTAGHNERAQLYDQVLDRLRAHPDVEAVAASTDLPIAEGFIFHNLAFEDMPVAPGTEPEVYFRGVSRDYFSSLQIPITRGRALETSDERGAPVAVVNEAFVREYFKDRDPLGRRVRWASDNTRTWITIVGVSADVRGLALDGPEVPAVHMLYRQDRTPWRNWIDVAVVARGSADGLRDVVAREVAAVDRTLPLMRVDTMTGVIARSIGDRRFVLTLVACFAGTALLLAMIGLYGVIVYTVNQRRHEFGVRVALGAGRAAVLRLVATDALRLVSAGAVLGVGGALATTKLLDTWLYGVGARDAATMTVVSMVLVVTAVAACIHPARRALAVDPVTALKER
jgi:putative ABC transport system permease protein